MFNRFKTFWLVMWHSLKKGIVSGEHRHCYETWDLMEGKGKRHFCSCGYLNAGMSWNLYIKMKEREDVDVTING